jgi:hypothetical protein
MHTTSILAWCRIDFNRVLEHQNQFGAVSLLRMWKNKQLALSQGRENVSITVVIGKYWEGWL